MGPPGEPAGDHVAPRLHLCEKIRIVFEGSIDCILKAGSSSLKKGIGWTYR
jgi:hypothetical protein